jgi:hypothetical protein
MEKIFILLVLFELKHFVADYPLQNDYMLGKFKDGKEFVLPLTAHALVNAALTFYIAYFFVSLELALAFALFDFAIHFTMDRMKAGKKFLGRYKALSASEFPSATTTQKWHNKFFWWSLGFDQMIHHFTHYAIIAGIIFFA